MSGHDRDERGNPAGRPEGSDRERRRPLAPTRLRPRLVVTFALVATAATIAVAVPSYVLVRKAILDRATNDAVREGRAVLEESADLFPPSPSPAQVREVAARLSTRGGFDMVAVGTDGRAESTSISRSAASVPASLAGRVGEGRVAWTRAGSGRASAVVVGGRLPGGPDLYLFFSLADLAADLNVLRNVLAAVGGGVVVLSGLLGAVAARRLLRPLRQARAAAHRLEVGLYETRLAEGGSDEFADLAHSFNRMAGALERSVAELRTLEANHRRFVSDVAHELRTPLTALTTSADVLDAHAAGLDEQGRRAAHLLVLESHRLAAMVEDLMEISRLDAGVAPMRWEPVDLATVVAGALELRGWSLRVEVRAPRGGEGDGEGRGGHVRTWADRRRLDAIVANMVGNALEHGSPPVTVTVAGDARHVSVSVTDAGPGIPPEHQEHLFDRFYKADPSRPRTGPGGGPDTPARRTAGSGLGLAIARENARLHGGDVTVATPPGGGTRFTLTLPRRSGPPDAAETPPRQGEPAVAQPLPAGDEAVTTARLTALTKPTRRRR